MHGRCIRSAADRNPEYAMMIQRERIPLHEKNEANKKERNEFSVLVARSRLSHYLLLLRILFTTILIDKRSSHGSDKHHSRRYAGKFNVLSLAVVCDVRVTL